MKILALETSAKSVSAAVTDGGVVRAYTYQNTGLTHSRTLMPPVDGEFCTYEKQSDTVIVFKVGRASNLFKKAAYTA